ncbi:MAG: type II toxin-antitoxin system RelE/ParE family toxin [Alphaproteobacteria bacterium]|nr:type II toxin-antitoxin system RelE/ParE family toxin [Alphaproteobacteria bacterium]
MKIKITETAKKTFMDNYNYIVMMNQDDNIAKTIKKDVYNKIHTLLQNYKMYRLIDGTYKQLLAYKDKYRILFTVDENKQIIYIHAILHGRQDITPYIQMIKK